MRSYTGSCLSIACLILSLWTQVCRSSGYLELRLSRVENSDGQLASGRCCGGGGVCACRTYFRACAKEYQVEVSLGGACIYGSASSSVLGANSFQLESSRDKHGETGTVLIPFEFAWPRAFTLIVEAWHWDNSTISDDKNDLLIERDVYRGEMNPGDEWQVIQHTGATASFQYSVRIRCERHYYGNKCNKKCRPRDDYFGHYECDHLGNQQCLEGWTGPECKTALCKQGCSELHGTCAVPGECTCHYGWQGPLCDECLTHPGCVHGTCVNKWECICEKNWGGLMCDQDLNYCENNRPCVNGGTCLNTEPNKYQCVCPEGYSGKNCEIVEPTVKLRSLKHFVSTYSAMLMCSAYNFYPKHINITWLRDGQRVTGGVTYTEEMADGDWYYQSHAYLEYDPKPWENVSCLVEHASFKQPRIYRWDPSLPGFQKTRIAVGAAGLLLGTVTAAAGLIFYWRHRRDPIPY